MFFVLGASAACLQIVQEKFQDENKSLPLVNAELFKRSNRVPISEIITSLKKTASSVQHYLFGLDTEVDGKLLS